MWSQVLDLKKFESCDGNVKFKSGSEWAFQFFFRVFNGTKILNDPNGLVLDFTFSKVVWSLIIIVCLELL